MKIKIVVEGKSDFIFLNELKKRYKLKHINIEISGGKNKCEITNSKTIKKIIENAKEDNYEKVIILIDKITQLECGIQYDCILDIKKEYKKKVLQNLAADIIVVDEEIECWFVLGDESIKNFYKRCYENAKTIFNTASKIQLAQRAVKKLDIILQNKTKNKSFYYFLEKINLKDFNG